MTSTGNQCPRQREGGQHSGTAVEAHTVWNSAREVEVLQESTDEVRVTLNIGVESGRAQDDSVDPRRRPWSAREARSADAAGQVVHSAAGGPVTIPSPQIWVVDHLLSGEEYCQPLHFGDWQILLPNVVAAAVQEESLSPVSHRSQSTHRQRSDTRDRSLP
jgi:hypothetical protein